MPTAMDTVLRPLDIDALKAQYRAAKPFPFFHVDGFLRPEFAREVADAYPSFEEAARNGVVFKTVNEQKKLQLTDASLFPPAVRRLHEALAAPEFLDALRQITGIDRLLADEQLDGGGIHETGPHGRLDVHVDFNYLEKRELHRRLNILIYLNPDWREDWGGKLELWDRDVKVCHHSFAPILNRCVVFETSEISFHGVTALTAPDDVVRKSFAAYYYTKEAPPGWSGKSHSTVFRARPDEKWKGFVRMPMEKLGCRLRDGLRSVKRGVKKLLGR
jgi:Rps23 Pro-64 3,4-dihydroxylase Tpa1-like proline 4-hydroxylase